MCICARRAHVSGTTMRRSTCVLVVLLSLRANSPTCFKAFFPSCCRYLLSLQSSALCKYANSVLYMFVEQWGKLYGKILSYFYLQQIRHLSTIGRITRRIMRNVLDHDVSLRYNNTGAKGKLAFQDNVRLSEAIYNIHFHLRICAEKRGV